VENSQVQTKENHTLAATFLVAGTCIGGGMLALPVATGITGFLPSIVVMLICWIAMTSSALLLMEVSLWMEEGVHVISMSSRLLGLPGKVVSWCLYLFICYASVVAYTAGGGFQIASVFKAFFNVSISNAMGCLIFIIAFGAVIYLGSQIVGRVNSILFIAMIVAYVGIVAMGVGEVKLNLLTTRRWSGALMALPLLLTSFSFQTMVPSLTPYLKKNAQGLRLAIIGGTTIAFIFYAIWQWLILGIVPVGGPNGLAAALMKGEPATQFLYEHVTGRWVAVVAEYFAFFALVTSFLGIALGLFDFLADGLKIKKEGFGKVIIGLLIAVPTLIFATYFERIFLIALDATGGYGDAILNGIIPVLMVWVGRYRMGYLNAMQVPGGKVTLILIFAFFLFSLILEILAHTGQIPSLYQSYELVELRTPVE
jgi:tyrosine-specific transport protein